jgi:hypothetical protein
MKAAALRACNTPLERSAGGVDFSFERIGSIQTREINAAFDKMKAGELARSVIVF